MLVQMPVRYLLVLLVLLAGAGCGGGSGPPADPTPAASVPEPTTVPTRSRKVTRDGVVGRYVEPRSGPRGVPVLALSGSEGGIPDRYAQFFASHGHPVLAQAYFGVPGTQSRIARVPLERLHAGLRWLQAETGERPAVAGGSRGGELALLLATTWPRDVAAVVALVPSAYRQPATNGRSPTWTLRGRALPYLPRDQFRATPPTDDVVRRTRIPIEDFDGPVLVAGGGSDTIWPSAAYTETLGTVLRSRTGATSEVLVYPLAGHGVAQIGPDPGWRSELGGTEEADRKARADLEPRVLAFLDR